MRKRIFLVCAIALLFVVPVAMASGATPSFMAVSPDSPVDVAEGETIIFDADVINPQPIPLTVEWFYDGVMLHNETIDNGGRVFWETTAEVGTHSVLLVVTAYDDTNATHEWTVIVPEPALTISGVTFYDYDGDGEKDVEEQPISKANVKVNVNGVEFTTKSNSDGTYLINVPTGTNIEIWCTYKGQVSPVYDLTSMVSTTSTDLAQNLGLQTKECGTPSPTGEANGKGHNKDKGKPPKG